MGRQWDGKDGKVKKSTTDPSTNKIETIAEKLKIDEIRPDPKIGKRVPFNPNERRRS